MFFIFLGLKPYHMVNSFTFQYLLGVFGLSLPIKGPVQRQFELLQNQTLSLPEKYLTTLSVDTTLNHILLESCGLRQQKCSSLYQTIRNNQRRCYVKKFFLRKNLCYSLQEYINISKKLQHRCLLVKSLNFLFFFFERLF